jgi:hypothetical protein
LGLFQWAANGEFNVLILQDDLSPEEAEELEAEWIAQESETLANWISSGRKVDFAKLDEFHKLRDSNRNLIAKAKATEKTDLEAAVAMYSTAISSIDAYAQIEYESGLVGELMREGLAATGRFGEVAAIDRLSLCLVRLGRVEEAARHVQSYFEKFAGDLRSAASERIKKRLEKALSRKTR